MPGPGEAARRRRGRFDDGGVAASCVAAQDVQHQQLKPPRSPAPATAHRRPRPSPGGPAGRPDHPCEPIREHQHRRGHQRAAADIESCHPRLNMAKPYPPGLVLNHANFSSGNFHGCSAGLTMGPRVGDRLVRGVDEVVLVSRGLDDPHVGQQVRCSGWTPLMITVIPATPVPRPARRACVRRSRRACRSGTSDDHHGDLRAVRIVIAGDGLRMRSAAPKNIAPSSRSSAIRSSPGCGGPRSSSRTTLLRRATVRSAKERREHDADLHRLDRVEAHRHQRRPART